MISDISPVGFQNSATGLDLVGAEYSSVLVRAVDVTPGTHGVHGRVDIDVGEVGGVVIRSIDDQTIQRTGSAVNAGGG